MKRTALFFFSHCSALSLAGVLFEFSFFFCCRFAPRLCGRFLPLPHKHRHVRTQNLKTNSTNQFAPNSWNAFLLSFGCRFP